MSNSRTTTRKLKYFESNPDKFKRIGQISDKIDFKSNDLKFPINVPLRFRWIYHNNPIYNQPLKHHDYLDFSSMKGNEILLYLEQAQNLRFSEIIAALSCLLKKDPTNSLNLKEHPWVKSAFKLAESQHHYFEHKDFNRFMHLHQRYGIENNWAFFEKELPRFIDNMGLYGYITIFKLAFSDDQQRFSEDLKKELLSRLNIHFWKFDAETLVFTFKVIQQLGMMDQLWFERKFHQLVWKRPVWFAQRGLLPTILQMLKDMKYEHDEYMYPDFYKHLQESYETIPIKHLKELGMSLASFVKAFPSHEQFNIAELIQKMDDRRVFEETTGIPARELTLIQIVQNDLKFYQEKVKLEIAEKQ